MTSLSHWGMFPDIDTAMADTCALMWKQIEDRARCVADAPQHFDMAPGAVNRVPAWWIGSAAYQFLNFGPYLS